MFFAVVLCKFSVRSVVTEWLCKASVLSPQLSSTQGRRSEAEKNGSGRHIGQCWNTEIKEEIDRRIRQRFTAPDTHTHIKFRHRYVKNTQEPFTIFISFDMTDSNKSCQVAFLQDGVGEGFERWQRTGVGGGGVSLCLCEGRRKKGRGRGRWRKEPASSLLTFIRR